MIIFSAIFLFLFALIVWRSREYGLGILIAALPLYLVRFSFGTLPFTLLEGMIGILFVWWVVRDKRLGATVGMLWRRYRLLSRALALFLIAATISIGVSGDVRAALGVWRAYFIEPAAVFLVAVDVIRTKDQLVRMIWASMMSAAVVAAIAVYQRFTGWHIPAPWLEELRVTSVYPYPNAVGLYLAPIIPLAVVRFFDSLAPRTRLVPAIFSLCAVALSLAAIFFAKTEAALVALAVVLPLMGMAWSMKTRVATVALCAVVAALIFLSPATGSSLQEKLFLNDWSGRVRQKIWKETRAMLSDRLILGAGLAGYQKALEPYHKATHLEIFLYPHTIALNFWSETGILGLFAFVLIVSAVFFLLFQAGQARNGDAARTRLYSLGLCGALLTIGIHGLVDAPYFKNDLAVFFWLLIAYAVCIQRNVQSKQNI